MFWLLLSVMAALVAADIWTTRRFIALGGKEGNPLVRSKDGQPRYLLSMVVRLLALAACVWIELAWPEGYRFGEHHFPNAVLFVVPIFATLWAVVGNLEYIAKLKRTAR